MILLGSQGIIKPSKIFTLFRDDEEWWKLTPTLKSPDEPVLYCQFETDFLFPYNFKGLTINKEQIYFI